MITINNGQPGVSLYLQNNINYLLHDLWNISSAAYDAKKLSAESKSHRWHNPNILLWPKIHSLPLIFSKS